jgi:hypothetical protein
MQNNENRICPWCGGDLESGTFRSRGGNYFLPEGEKMPLTYSYASMEKRNAVKLPPFFLSFPPDDWPKAYVCRNCRKIIIPY